MAFPVWLTCSVLDEAATVKPRNVDSRLLEVSSTLKASIPRFG
jgi:hypothetical protein